MIRKVSKVVSTLVQNRCTQYSRALNRVKYDPSKLERSGNHQGKEADATKSTAFQG